VTIRHLTRPAAGAAEGALVLLHGRGADEHDLVPLLDAIDPERRLVGVTPRGPLTLPPGGAHWYRLGGIGTPDPESFLPTYDELGSWLDGLPEITGVPLARTVVGGFSQGCVMTYAMVYGRDRPSVAAALCLSGFLPTVEGFELDMAGAASTPVAVAHGRSDPVIGFAFGEGARDRLLAAGAHPVWLPSELGHTIDPRHLPALRELVFDALPDLA
jgi:phospholipase/carboxylesterase